MKIFCIGRNYVAHARELGNDVPDAPVIFMKPPTALVVNGKPVFYPGFTRDLHYEGELVIRISRNGKSIQPQFAHKYYEEVSLGFDLTARDLQSELKAKGLPWEIAKGFDGAAPIGRFIPLDEARDADGNFHFDILKNGSKVQDGRSELMIFPVDQLISYISGFFRIQKGDMIFTGTPSGVGPLAVGDVLTGVLNGHKLTEVQIK